MQKYAKKPLSFDELTDFEHLYKAHKIARCSKRHKFDIIDFENKLFYNLAKLEQKLKCGTYKVGNYKKFYVFEPKKREIQALGYKDRIVQHSLCDNFLIPYYKNKLILCNCACQEGKGTYFARKKLKSFMCQYIKKYGDKGYILKCDIKKYFANINHNILKEQLKKIKDKKIFNLLCVIIDSYNKDSKKGMPIGNQVSQIMGIVYLNKLDRLIKEELHIKYYVRYMDDLILIHQSKQYLNYCLKKMEEVLNELKLQLNNKTQIYTFDKSIEFVGAKYIVNSKKILIKIRKSTIVKMKTTIRSVEKLKKLNIINNDYITSSINGVRGHFKGYNANNIYIKFKKAILS